MSDLQIEIAAEIPQHVVHMFQEKFDPGTAAVAASGIGPMHIGTFFKLDYVEGSEELEWSTSDYFDDKISINRVVISGGQEGETTNIAKPISDTDQCLIYYSPQVYTGGNYRDFNFAFWVTCSGTGGDKQLSSADRGTAQQMDYIIFSVHFSGVDFAWNGVADETPGSLIEVNSYTSIEDSNRNEVEGDPIYAITFPGTATGTVL